MKNIISLFLIVLTSNVFSQKEAYEYPNLLPSDHVDVLHEVKVSDPYRFLEEFRSSITQEWLDKQIKLSKKYIFQTNLQASIYKRIERRTYSDLNYEKKIGDYFFSYRFKFKNQSPSLYFRKYNQKIARLLINPSRFDADTTTITSIVDVSVSNDSKFLAFSTSASGSDWKEIRIINLENKRLLVDKLKWIKYSDIVWDKAGFYYTRFEQPPIGEEKIALNQNSRVYYHAINTEQTEDKLIYEQQNLPFGLFNIQKSNKNNLIVYGAENVGSNYSQNIYLKSLESNTSALKQLIKSDLDLNYSYEIIAEKDSQLIVLSNASKGLEKAIYSYDYKGVTNYKPFIESNNFIRSAHLLSDKIVVISRNEMELFLNCYDLDGKELDRRKFIAGTSISNISANYKDSILYFYLNTYTTQPRACSYNVHSKALTINENIKKSFPEIKLITEVVKYPSIDGTLIPMTIIRREDLAFDGNNPTIIYAYGGFGVPIEPFYDAGFIYFVQNGGIVAIPGIRGGGENGERWHQEGRLLKKKNAIQDIAYAAKYLIKQRVTNPDKLCARGSSNGAMLIAACINFYPELFKAVVLEMGIYDMIRYHLFTTGYLAASEYGTAIEKEEFDYLRSYSPIHTINSNKKYPSIYVISASNDDRAPVLHSFKYVATLQSLKQKQNIVLLDYLDNAGHYGPQSFDAILLNESSIYSFIFKELSIKLKIKY